MGRSRERYRRVLLGAGTAVAAKFLAAACALITVPLVLTYLGPERYGVLMVATSMTLVLTYADFGLGSGVTIAIAEASGLQDAKAPGRYVSTAFFLLLPLALLLTLLLALVYPHIDWARLVNAASQRDSHEIGPAFAVLILCTLAGLPLSVVTRVQIGQQHTMVANVWGVVGTVTATACVVATVMLGGSLPALVFATVAPPVLAQALNWVTSGNFIEACPKPRVRQFEWTAARRLLTIGGNMFLQQGFILLWYFSDPFIITRIAGPGAVATYSVVQRLFTFGYIAQFITQALWPAFAEATARGEHGWTQTALRRTLLLTIGAQTLLVLPVLMFGRALLHIVVGPQIAPTFGLLSGFSLWVLLAGYVSTMNAFLNHGHTLRAHVSWLGVASIVSVVLKILFCRQWGSTGVVWATVLAFSVLYIPATIWLTSAPSSSLHAYLKRVPA